MGIGRTPHRLCASAALALIVLSVAPAAAQTLAAIRERGALVCGVSEGILGFSIETATGWTGFDVDFCRALAVAALGDSNKVRYVPLDAESRFAVLQSGNIDVLSRNSTWTMSREIELKLVFPAITYFDGQGFIVRKARNATSALELGGAKICVQGGTTSELNLADYFLANDMKLERITFSEASEAVRAYDSGRCDALTSDVSQLYAVRLTLTAPDDHV